MPLFERTFSSIEICAYTAACQKEMSARHDATRSLRQRCSCSCPALPDESMPVIQR